MERLYEHVHQIEQVYMRMDEDDSEGVSEESEGNLIWRVLVVCQVHLMMQNQNCELLYAIVHIT